MVLIALLCEDMFKLQRNSAQNTLARGDAAFMNRLNLMDRNLKKFRP